MLHCSHGQRAGSSLGMILYRDYGYSKEAAFKAATDAGMNSEWAVPRFWKFIESSIVKVKPVDGIKNMVKYKNFYIASQPSPEAINKLKEMGVTTVITNRAQKENGGYEEQKAVEAAGLKFHRARIYNDRYGDINDQKINIGELEKALGIIASTTDGDVFRSFKTVYERSFLVILETRLSGSFRSPKTRALGGQLATQAGVTSPSRTLRRSSSLALSLAIRIRWMQKVHFSMTPWPRTVTSGFKPKPVGSGQLWMA